MKVAVITGASAGIGRATAEYFAERGYRVVNLSRRAAEGIESIPCDVTDAAAVKDAFAKVHEQCGSIDVVICNAGMGISGSIEDTPEVQARKIFDVNFFGVLNTVQAALPYLRGQGGGRILTVSSVAAKLALPFQSMYSATKAAVTSLTDALRLEAAPFGVKVSSVLPGDVRTDFTSSREKNPADNGAYGERVTASVERMEKDEQNGMSPRVIAKLLFRLATVKNPPVYVVGGKSYSLFVVLSKILPARLVSWAVGKLYA